MEVKIPAEAKLRSVSSQATDKEATSQKASQVAAQAQSLQQQGSAKAADIAQDAKAASDKIKKELGQIPQKIEEIEDDTIETLKKLLGAQPTVKKVKVKTADGFEYNKPDFNADTILKNIDKLITPVTSIASVLPGPSIPVLGDLTALLAKMTSDNSGETELSEEELYKLMPNPPDIPKSVTDKAQTIVKLIGQALQFMPFLLIGVIGEMLNTVISLFSSLGVSAPAPLSLVPDLCSIATKAQALITQMPSQIEDILEQKLTKKFHYAAALSVPKPNLGAAKSAAAPGVSSAKDTTSPATGSMRSTSVSSEAESAPAKIEQSQTPPVESSIPDTPSVPEATPKPPVKKPPERSGFFKIQIYSHWGTVQSEWGYEEENEIDPSKTRINLNKKSDTETLTDRIDKIIKDYPNICKVGDHYEYNSLIKQMTKAEAYSYFDRVFAAFWKSTKHVKCGGNRVEVLRHADVDMRKWNQDQVIFCVTYKQFGYDDDDNEVKFPDGFLTI